MKRTVLAFAIVACAVVAYTFAEPAPDGREITAAAMKALGADSLRTVEFTGSGFDYAIGQNPNPNLPWPKFNDKTYTRSINLETPSTRMTRIRTQAENPPHGGGQQPIIGEQTQNQQVAPGTPASATLQDELMMTTPYSFLRAAAAASDLSMKSATVGGKKFTVLTFTALNKAPASGYLNAENILERVETKIDNPVLGDIVYETAYTGYKDFGGVKFPTHIVQKQGGFPVLDLTVTDVKPNAPVTLTPNAAPGGGGGAPAVPAPEKLSDGVYLILGGYASLAIDMKDHILIIEGATNDQRSDQVMAEARRLIPNKPITELVNTHSHFDHAGGLRDYVAEGVTIITQKINEPYFKKVWSNPHTVAPDKLAKNPRKPVIKTVDEHMTLTDGNHVVELYHQTGFGHHDGMLLVYLPKEKVLVEADGFNPPPQPVTQTPATISPYNTNLLDNIDRLKLDVERIIPIHYPGDNRKVTLAELKKVSGRTE